MENPIVTIGEEFGINLEGLAERVKDKNELEDACETYLLNCTSVAANPLDFCMHLRRSGLPLVAKTICEWFLQNNPGALSRVSPANN